MAYLIATYTKSGGNWAHENFIDGIKAAAEAAGYDVVRYVNTGANREVIFRAYGYSEIEEFYIGFKTYTDATTIGSQYFNLGIMAATGYVSGNSFESQTNGKVKYAHANGNAMDCVLSISPQRIAGTIFTKGKRSQPIYAGKFFSYSPTYEMPLFVAGSLTAYNQKADVLLSPGQNLEMSPYDNQANSISYTQASGLLDGSLSWKNHNVLQFHGISISGGTAVSNIFNKQVPYNDVMAVEPLCVSDIVSAITPVSFYGELEGFFAVTPYNNESFNLIQIAGSSSADITGMTVAQAVAAIHAVAGRAFFTMEHYSSGDNNTFNYPLVAMEIKA